MFVKLNPDNFKLLCELFADAIKEMCKVDAPKQPNAYNPSAIDISYFRPKPTMRISYDGKLGYIYLPDDTIIEKG